MTAPPGPLDRRPGEPTEDYYERLNKHYIENAPVTERIGNALEDAGDAVAGFFSGDYCDCIFDKMPSVNNDVAASDIRRECAKSGTFCEQKSGSWFGVSSASECIEKYGKKTSSGRAAQAIAGACRNAYR
jgi:hypothetical protein